MKPEIAEQRARDGSASLAVPTDTLAIEASALDRISAAVELYKPVAVWAAFSGGDDSLTVTTIASKHPAFTGAMHWNTGIGVTETREFVRETCRRMGWPLREVRADEDCGQNYEALVVDQGFPGPGMHGKMYQRLKERCQRVIVRESKTGHSRRAKVLFVAGRRSQESKRRKHTTKEIEVKGSTVWVSAIHDWSKKECIDYLDAKGQRRNPVSENLHLSGECLCGAFAGPCELDQIRFFYPKTADHITALEKKVAAAGKFQRFWGCRAIKGPDGLPVRGTDNAHAKEKPKSEVGPGCHRCQMRFEFAEIGEGGR